MNDLNDMVVFAKVVETGGFTAAGEAIDMPKSNVSRRVSRLEERLGVRLLERTTRKIRMTELGEIYYAHCRRIIEEAEHADIRVSQALEVPRGQLRVSASVTVGQNIIGPVLGQFVKAYPEVKIQMTLTNRRVDLIEEGFDIAVRVGQLEDSSLVARLLGKSELILFASPDYLKRNGEPRTPSDLKDHHCIVMSDQIDSTLWMFVNAEQKATLKIKPQLAVNDFHILRQLLVEDCGIGRLPNYMAIGWENKLQRVLLKWVTPPIDIHAVYPSHRGATPKVRAFLDFLINSRLSG